MAKTRSILQETGLMGPFSCDLGFPILPVCDSLGLGLRLRGMSDEQAARQPSEGPAAAGAGRDHRSGPSAGASGARDRLGFSRWAFPFGVPVGTRSAAASQPACGGAFDPQAHARFVGRGSMRALDRESVLPVPLRRGELPACAAVRALLVDALAPTAGRGTSRGADPGEPGGGTPDRVATRDLERVVVDTTVQPKNVAFPTD